MSFGDIFGPLLNEQGADGRFKLSAADREALACFLCVPDSSECVIAWVDRNAQTAGLSKSVGGAIDFVVPLSTLRFKEWRQTPGQLPLFERGWFPGDIVQRPNEQRHPDDEGGRRPRDA